MEAGEARGGMSPSTDGVRWAYCGTSAAGFTFRVEGAACSAGELLATIGCSRASRGRMLARGQVVRVGAGGSDALRAAEPKRAQEGTPGPGALRARRTNGRLAAAAAGRSGASAGRAGVLAASSRLAPGDVVAIAPQVTREAGPSSDAFVSVLYEDEFVLAVDKPAGVLVHGDGSDAETLTARVQGYLRRKGSAVVPQALQRLDVETSGVVLFSKVEEFQPLFDALVAGESVGGAEAGASAGGPGRAQQRGMRAKPVVPGGDRASVLAGTVLGEASRVGAGVDEVRAALAAKPLRKTYLAIVRGAVPWEERVCAEPIGRDRHDARRMRVSPTGQPSLTLARCLAVGRDGRHTLLRVELGSGRRHQIRVHLAHLGFPIEGDELYGGGRPGAPGLLLHAACEEFIHPLTRAFVRIEAPYPQRFVTHFPGDDWLER